MTPQRGAELAAFQVQTRDHGADVENLENLCLNRAARLLVAIKTRSPKVNMPHAINFRALRGANLITYPPDFWRNEPFEIQRAGAG